MNRLLVLLSLFLSVRMHEVKSQNELIQPDFIKKHVLANHAKLVGIKGNLTTFKKYLTTLDTSLLSIPYALDYIKTCIPARDTATGDSVFYYFRNEFNSVVNKLSDSILSEYKPVIKRMDTSGSEILEQVGYYDVFFTGPSLTPEANALLNNLDFCGIYLMGNDMDGNCLDAKTNYFYDNFKDRITKDVSFFLIERQKEITQGFYADGDITISFDTIYNRAVVWEKFNAAYPNSIFGNESHCYYDMYLVALLINFNSLDEAYILKPEMKPFYEKIIQNASETKTKQIISAWYNTLSQHAFNANDSLIDTFFTEHDLHDRFSNDPPQAWIDGIGK
jgi:hypothetical protein